VLDKTENMECHVHHTDPMPLRKSWGSVFFINEVKMISYNDELEENERERLIESERDLIEGRIMR
jgi:hypothetical protein